MEAGRNTKIAVENRNEHDNCIVKDYEIDVNESIRKKLCNL